MTNPTPNVSDAANKAWVDYEPPKTALSQTHHQTMISKHAFVAGYNAALSTQAQDVPANAELADELESEARDFGIGAPRSNRDTADLLRRAANALRSTPQPVGEWQPIETAPKDEKALLCWPDGKVAVGWFDDQRHHKNPKPRWTPHHMGARYEQQNQPTYWQPLPKPPLYAGRTA